MNVRLARDDELDRINELRKQVNELHAAGKPEIFRPDFTPEMRDFIHVIRDDPDKDIAVAEREGQICAFAVLHHIRRPENMVKREQEYLDIDEFGVDEACRRQGVGTELMAYIRRFAAEKGLRRIELNMWEFNQSALAFYEELGFTTFRRYMELYL